MSGKQHSVSSEVRGRAVELLEAIKQQTVSSEVHGRAGRAVELLEAENSILYLPRSLDELWGY